MNPLLTLAQIAGVEHEEYADPIADLPRCTGCDSRLRRKGAPKAPNTKLRHTSELCSTCYHRGTRDEPASGVVFTHCTVCCRQFGSIGKFGGTVRLGTKTKGICTTCRDRAVQARKRAA